MITNSVKTSLVAVAAGTLLAALSIAPAAAADAVKPASAVEIYVGANPGGGYDRMARAIQGVIEKQKLLNVPLNITYRPGGGGAVAWATINRYPGDMTKLSIFSPNLITDDVLGTSPVTYKNLSMLSTMVFEDGCFAVNPKGKIKDAKGLVDALKKDPGHLRFGFAVAAGNQWHVAMAVLADEVGSDITKVRSTVFSSGGKAVAALLGQHTDVAVSGCASFAKHNEAGDLKIVAVAGEHRLGGPLASVPTWKELGHNVVWSAWRGIVGPKGLKPGQVKFWEDEMQKVLKSSEWPAVAAKNYWRTEFLNQEQTVALMVKQRAQYAKTLKQLGLIK